MAPMPFNDSTQDQRDALSLLLDYCLRARSLEVAQILTGADISNDEYQNFRRGKSNAHYRAISTFMETTTLARLKKMNRIPAFMKPMISVCFRDFFADDNKTISDANEIFFKYVERDPHRRREISEAYSGIFHTYRYSSHLNKPPPKLQVETRDGKQLIDDPWMICAAIEIYPASEHDEFQRFKLYYSPGEVKRDAEVKISNIDGIIVIIRDLLYFIGLERNQNPLTMIFERQFDSPIDTFTGMILRYHDYKRTIASRIGFKRAPNAKSIDELRGEIGMERESELVDEIAVFNRMLINTVDYDGKCALLAPLP